MLIIGVIFYTQCTLKCYLDSCCDNCCGPPVKDEQLCNEISHLIISFLSCPSCLFCMLLFKCKRRKRKWFMTCLEGIKFILQKKYWYDHLAWNILWYLFIGRGNNHYILWVGYFSIKIIFFPPRIVLYNSD